MVAASENRRVRLTMLRLILLLGAGGYIYSLGHNSAVHSAEAAEAQPSLVTSVARTGATWIAREVHEQTAWAAEDAETAPQPAAAPRPQQPPPQPRYAPVAAEFAEPQPVALAAPPARRGLQVIIEPASAS
jgi:hypothetical protein